MVHKTKGIVLKSIKYVETSLVTTIYTELFGIQTYLINGVRQISTKGSTKSNMFQPSSILELETYHNDLKNLQRLKEYKWSHLYRHVLSDVIKNSVASFMIELLQKTLKQPEPNPELFQFIEDCFLHLDEAERGVVANFPLFFAIQLSNFFGFRFVDTYSETRCFLDLREGEFVSERPLHPHFLENPYSKATSEILKVMHPEELSEIKLNQDMRRVMLHAYQDFYRLQVNDFGQMKSLPVLQEVLG